MSSEAAWVLGPFIAGAGVFIALGLFDIGSALRELRRRRERTKPDTTHEEGRS